MTFALKKEEPPLGGSSFFGWSNGIRKASGGLLTERGRIIPSSHDARKGFGKALSVYFEERWGITSPKAFSA